ncbi:MAG: hypothetical protein IPM26_03070 [Saprospiraceae bacterium]|nr:hypothetical protein [Saprospiraceae bacterium]
MMDQRAFDRIIQKKLKNYNPDNSTADWSAFLSSLQAENDLTDLYHDMEFDDKVREEVKKIQTGSPSLHWMKLKQALQIIDERKRELWAAAFAQLLIVLSSITISLDYLPYLPKSPEYNEYATGQIQKDNKKQIAGNEKINFDKHTKAVKANIKPWESLNILKTSNDSDYTDLVNVNMSYAIQDDVSVIPVVFENKQILDKPVSGQESYLSLIGEVMADEYGTSTYHNITAFSPTYKSENVDAFIAYRSDEQKTTGADLAFVPVKKAEGIRKSVSAFYSSDVNLINTPFDKVYSVASYSKEAFNQSAGVLLSFRKGDLTLETGVRYTDLQYFPKIIKEEHNQVADLYFETSLDKIAFKIINVPFHLKYHFLNSPGWSSYLVCGAGFNLIAESDFDITTNIRQGRRGLRSNDQDLRLIDEKRFNLGIFEGGGIKENYFITGVFGVGLERQVFGPVKIFTQALYNRHLFSDDIGVGPNKDKIHTMSFQGGVKVTL